MTKLDKLLEKIYSLDPNLRFDQLAKILESYGYKANETQGGSSHITFRKAGCNPITIPRHNPIKKAYIEIIRDVIKRESDKS